MTDALDIYMFYLKPADLRERSYVVTVETAKEGKVFDSRHKKDEPKILVRFAGGKKWLACNKTQVQAFIDITGSSTIEKWVGAEVVIEPGKQSGKDTIIVTTREGCSDVDLRYPKPAVRTPAPASGPKNKYELVESLLATAPKAAFDTGCIALGLKEAALEILRECENDYRTATERLLAQNKPLLQSMAIPGNAPR